MSDIMDLVGAFVGSMMAFFFLGRLLKYDNAQKSRLGEAKPPTQADVAVEIKEAREEAKTSASQKVETLTQEVKANAQDAEAAAAALRDSQL